MTSWQATARLVSETRLGSLARALFSGQVTAAEFDRETRLFVLTCEVADWARAEARAAEELADA